MVDARKFEPRPTEEVFAHLVETREGFREAYDRETGPVRQSAPKALAGVARYLTGDRKAVIAFESDFSKSEFARVRLDGSRRLMTVEFYSTGGKRRAIVQNVKDGARPADASVMTIKTLRTVIEETSPTVRQTGEGLTLAVSPKAWPVLKRFAAG